MKWSIIKHVALIGCLYLCSTQTLLAEENRELSTKYDKRVHRYKERWEKLIPSQTKLQYAGGMGFLSAGIGWDYGKRDQWESDIFIGFIPKYDSKRAKTTMTLKQSYLPWSFDLKKGFSIEPLACGLYFNTVFGDEFWVREIGRAHV